MSCPSKSGSFGTISSQKTVEPPCRQGEDTNVLILETKAKKPASEAGPDSAPAPAKRLSKSQKRKLRKIEEDKAKRAERAQVLPPALG